MSDTRRVFFLFEIFKVSLSVARCLPFLFADNGLPGRLAGVVTGEEVCSIDRQGK